MTSQVLRGWGLHVSSGNYRTFKKYVSLWNLDTSHFKIIAFGGRLVKSELSSILVQGSVYSSTKLKKRLLTEGLLEDLCSECGLTSWRGKPLSLQLDHVNGDPSDNRLSNLRVLCPNCHSQTATYAGRSKRKTRPACIDCGVKVKVISSKRCSSCNTSYARSFSTLRQFKITWPSREELANLVWEKPLVVLSLELGVSDTAIRKRCKRLGIPWPGRGHWQKK